MSAVIGAGGFLGFAEESTYGTAVVPSTAWLGPGLNRSTLGEQRVRQVVGTLGTFSATPGHHNAHRSIQTERNVGGQIEWVPHYAGYSTIMLLKHALGAVNTTGAGPYAHEITWDRDGVTGLTIQQNHGQHGSLNLVERFTGCRIDQLEISAQARSPLMCRATFIGAEGLGLTTISGTPDFTSEAEEIQADHGGTFTWNSVTHRCLSWTIRVQNALSRRPYVGSQLTDCPEPSGLASVMFEAEVEWVANDLYNDFRAETQDDVTLSFAGAGNNAMAIDLHNLILDRCDKPVDGAGIRSFTIGGQCFAGTTATETGIEITMTNDNTGAIA